MCQKTELIMPTINLLLPVIRQFEGCKLTAYRCPAGVWTVGWGATGANVKSHTKWTQSFADGVLCATARDVVTQVVDASPILSDANPSRVAALADFVYNLGIGNYKSSTLKECVDDGDWARAAEEIVRWDKCGGKPLVGLTRRRAVEAAMLK